jgi:hypothetical protein
MNDIYIYKQKAEKYKNKYLKLKQELEGGVNNRLPWDHKYKDDDDDDDDRITDTLPSEPKEIRTTKASDCTKQNYINSEDLKILNIKPDYPNKKTNIEDIPNYYEYEYDRRLLSNNKYEKELNNYKKIKNIKDIDITHVREIVFAGKIYNFNLYNIFSKTKMFELLEIIYFLCKISNKNYGYIISKKININSTIETFDILKLRYLITAIDKFIIPLHNARFVLNNIKWENIIIDLISKKIIFDISKITESINTEIDIKALYELGYQFIEEKDKQIINPEKYKDINHLKDILNRIIIHPNRKK